MDHVEFTVIGGGPAGLQAALTLGRMHRDVVLLDSGSYRNAPAAHMHNFATHDGRSPVEFRAMARADLASYATVAVRDVAATEVGPCPDGGFETVLADGTSVRSSAVLLATGVRDVLPDVPGLAELFGTLVHHCPFCHGHELAGGVVAVEAGPRSAHLVPMLSRIAAQVVEVGPIHNALPDGDRLVLELDEGPLIVHGLFAASTFEQAAPFAAQLGLAMQESGCIQVDAMGRTSLPGVYAAGDLAHSSALPMPMSSVLAAAAAGQLAASACVADSMMAAHAR